MTLSASHQSETWDPEAKAEYPRSNKLLIRQVLLGPDAKPDELNVVQVKINAKCILHFIRLDRKYFNILSYLLTLWRKLIMTSKCKLDTVKMPNRFSIGHGNYCFLIFLQC